MAKNLTSATTWATNVTVPEGGDARRTSTVETPFQQLADRSEYLRQQVDVVGVNRIRYVATPTAAKALTTLTEGDCVVIGLYGLYRFTDTAQLNTIGTPWQLAVTSGGYLCFVGSKEMDYPTYRTNMLVATGATGKLMHPDVVPNRIVFDRWFAYDDTMSTFFASTTATSMTTLTHSTMGTVAINVYGAEAGDVLSVQFTGSVYFRETSTPKATYALFEVDYDDLTSPIIIPGCVTKIASQSAPISGYDDCHTYSMIGSYTLTADAPGLASVYPKAAVKASTTTMWFNAGGSLRVTCIRP